MTLGLPPHLASQTLGHSFSRAVHAVAYTCLAAALLLTVAFQSADPQLMLWPALVALGLMGAALGLNDRFPSTFLSVSYLAIGGASAYWFVVVFYSQTPAPAATYQTPSGTVAGTVADVGILGSDAFPIALVKIALVMVGGSGSRLVARVTWGLAGYVMAEISVRAAAFVLDRPSYFDLTTSLVLLLMIAIFVFAALSRRTFRRTQPMLHRAARDEKLAAMRFRLEVKAAALMHDTVLSHLAAIAGSTARPLDPQLANQIEHDLATIVGEEWLNDDVPEIDYRASSDWRQSELFMAIAAAQVLGLEVECTGDLNAVSRVQAEAARSLALAVKQCLVNVLLHSGVTRAEVAIFGSETEVSVMVIDAGHGFSEADNNPDRLGLRHSVRHRMEVVGGSVQVWSTIGRGTSIMIRVPTAVSSESPPVGPITTQQQTEVMPPEMTPPRRSASTSHRPLRLEDSRELPDAPLRPESLETPG